MARGSIRQRVTRAGVVFDVTFDVPDASGKRRQRRRTFTTRREAESFLAAEITAVNRGERVHTPPTTFAAYAADWLEAKRPRIEASTYRDYEIHLRLRLSPAFGKLRLDRITRSAIERYLADVDAAGTVGRKVINDSLIPLRQVLGRAVRERIIATNPAVSTDRDNPLELPYEAPPRRPLTRAEAEAYLAAAYTVRGRARGDQTTAWYGPIADILLGAGLRIGEALAIEWRDVDLEGSALHVARTTKYGGIGTPKANRPRTVYIGPDLTDALRRHRALTGRIAGLVFPSATGTPMDRYNVRRRGHDVTLKRAGITDHVRPHDLRHTYATLALAMGASIYFVKEQLGHADIQTTIDLYGHPDQAAHREQAARLDAFWRGSTSADA